METASASMAVSALVTARWGLNPSVKNYSYAVVDGEVYYRQNSVMVKPHLTASALMVTWPRFSTPSPPT